MGDYGFRPVTHADLPMLADWLHHPAVAEYWQSADEQIALIEQDLREQIVTPLLALHDGQPIGYAQHYPAHHWPTPHFAQLPEDTIAVDVFSAPQGFGHGAKWLRALTDNLLINASTVAIDPAPTNLRAIRAYQKAGFAGDLETLDAEGELVRVMTRRR